VLAWDSVGKSRPHLLCRLFSYTLKHRTPSNNAIPSLFRFKYSDSQNQESQVKQNPKPGDLHKDLRPANTAPFLFRSAILVCKFTMNTSGENVSESSGVQTSSGSQQKPSISDVERKRFWQALLDYEDFT